MIVTDTIQSPERPMLEYILFDEQSLDRFLAWLEQRAIPREQRRDEMGLLVAIPDDLDDETTAAVEAYYEKLLADTETLLAEAGQGPEKHAAALTIRLGDGRTVQAGVPPALLNRVLSAISVEELNQLVEAIVVSIENPDDRPFCQR
jgi:hypothetical protein